MIARQQHSALSEVDCCALEVDFEVFPDRCEAESIGDASVSCFPFWLDMLQACDGMDAIAAHEDVSRRGTAIFKLDGNVVWALLDADGSLSTSKSDVLVLSQSLEYSFQRISTGDAESFERRIADSLALWSFEVRFGNFARIGIEDFEEVDVLSIVVLADVLEGSEMVEHAESIGSEVNGSADCRGLGTDFEDLDARDLAFGSEFGEGESCC